MGEQKMGLPLGIGDWGLGKKSRQTRFTPHLFPRFGVQVNVALCTPLQRKTLIYQ
jgi:hypothetical protein